MKYKYLFLTWFFSDNLFSFSCIFSEVILKQIYEFTDFLQEK